MKAFAFSQVAFLMYIFTLYSQKWLIDVILYSPSSRDWFEPHLFGFYFYITLWMVNNKVCFNSILSTGIITMQYFFMFMESK